MSNRSKRFLKLKPLIDTKKIYNVEEALDLLEKTANVKFDSSAEIHIKLGIDSKKGNEVVRGSVSLPHGSGRTKRVAVFTNTRQKQAKDAGADIVGGTELIESIKKDGKCDFDSAVADPEIMKELALIAKILGPKGLMPSPKNETVTSDVASAVSQLKKGKVNFKNDDQGNVHIGFGKMSFGREKLKENFYAFFEAVKSAKPAHLKRTYIKGIAICTTMGPSVKVAV